MFGLVAKCMALEIRASTMTAWRVPAIFSASSIENPLPVVEEALRPDLFHRILPKVETIEIACGKRTRFHVHPLVNHAPLLL
jgi:hypothetical protein